MVVEGYSISLHYLGRLKFWHMGYSKDCTVLEEKEDMYSIKVFLVYGPMLKLWHAFPRVTTRVNKYLQVQVKNSLMVGLWDTAAHYPMLKSI
jgi:hypothetical protein